MNVEMAAQNRYKMTRNKLQHVTTFSRIKYACDKIVTFQFASDGFKLLKTSCSACYLQD